MDFREIVSWEYNLMNIIVVVAAEDEGQGTGVLGVGVLVDFDQMRKSLGQLCRASVVLHRDVLLLEVFLVANVRLPLIVPPIHNLKNC
jgi:hypothetical protein